MRRVLLALLLSAGAALAGTAPAEAGGPTSVLLVNPTAQTTASLYYTDPEYAELEELLHGPTSDGATSATAPRSTSQVTVTWLVHDVSVWRTDIVSLDGSGAVWRLTSTEQGGPDGLGDEGWTRLRQPERVRDLLASLGLLGDAAPAQAPAAPADTAGQAQDRAEAPAVAAPAPPPAPEATQWFSLAGWHWAVPGLVAGLLVAGAALRRSLPRPDRLARATRQELVDRTPASTR